MKIFYNADMANTNGNLSPTDEEIVAFTVRIPRRVKTTLEILASGYGLSLSAYVTDVFESHIRQLPAELQHWIADGQRTWEQVKEAERKSRAA